MYYLVFTCSIVLIISRRLIQFFFLKRDGVFYECNMLEQIEFVEIPLQIEDINEY